MTTTPTQADRPVDPADIEAVARALQGTFTGYLGYGDASELAVAAIDTLIARGNHSALAASEARDVGELTDEQIIEIANAYRGDWCDPPRNAELICFAHALLATRASEPAPHVGESRFESWYADYLLSAPVHQEPKQRARDAYAAGMGEAAPVAVGDAKKAFLTYWCRDIPEHLRAKWEERAGENLDTPDAADRMQTAWEGWQAALASQAAPDARQASEPSDDDLESLASACGLYGVRKAAAAYAREAFKLYAASQPARDAQATAAHAGASDEADMFWTADDGDRMFHSLDDAIIEAFNNDCGEVGAELEFTCAARLPNVKVRITGVSEEGWAWEEVTASTPDAAKGEPA